MANYGDMPDIGSLGGNMYGDDGENSVTTGGQLSSEQNDANIGVNTDPWGYDFGSAGFGTPGGFSLGSLFGYNAPQGLPTSTGDYTGNASDYGFGNFLESPFGKVTRAALGMTPLGAVANAGYNLSKGNYGGAVSNFLGGPAGSLVGLGVNAAMGKSSPGAVGSTIGGLAGGMAGGPIGSFAGSMLGCNMFSGSGGGYSGTQSPGGNGLDYGALASGLAGLYMANKGSSDAGKAASGATDSANASLESMFGANSAAAQQMRQELDRRDAASGRRSQYGPREVELQAALAKLKAGAYPGMVNANVNASNASLAAKNAQRVKQNQMLSSLLYLGKNSGAFSKLGDMFGGGQQAPNISAGEFGQLPDGYNAFGSMTASPNSLSNGGDSGGGDWWDNI